MGNTFDTVDLKAAEAEFFLGKMCGAGARIDEFGFYFSAFLSAARTTTLALQHFSHVCGFDEWYAPHRAALAASSLAKQFLDLRNSHLHGGEYPVGGGTFQNGKAEYFLKRDGILLFSHSNETDLVSMSRRYLVMLLEIVHDCYVNLGVHVDPQQHYTKEHFATLGKTIEHAEAEILGFVCPPSVAENFSEDDRWHSLRSKLGGCQINHLFYSYLGRVTPQPAEPENFADFEFTPAEKGWLHIPAGFASIEDYIASLPKSS